jgi:REP element-mobilizing transposase RayT
MYLVTACCDERRRIFESSTSAGILITEFRHQHDSGRCASLAYVAMPDHFHWLVQLTGACSMEKLVGRTKGRSARRINAVDGRQGRIWQPGFHDHAVRAEESIEATANYMIHNPVRAGLVGDPHEYPYWDTVWHQRCRA